MKTVFKSGTPDSIAQQLAAEVSGCSFLIYCADDKRFAAISSALHEQMPDVQMIGTTGFMFNQSGSFAEGVSAIAFWDNEVEVRVGALRQADSCPIKYLPALSEAVQTIGRKYKNNVCFELSTGYEERIVSTMKVVLEPAKIRLIGGTAGNTTEGSPKKVSCNGEVLTDATVFAVIGSKLGKIEIFKENLFHRGKIFHSVTKVSEDERTVYELDGRKAMDVYEEELGYSKSNVQEGVFKNPLCRIVGQDSYITAIFSFNPDRSISTYKNCQKNDLISFTHIDSEYQQFIEGNMEKLTASHKVKGIISINCILRYLFFENSGYTGTYARMMSSKANGCHWGVVGDGEQYVEQHINQSMVCVVFTSDL